MCASIIEKLSFGTFDEACEFAKRHAIKFNVTVEIFRHANSFCATFPTEWDPSQSDEVATMEAEEEFLREIVFREENEEVHEENSFPEQDEEVDIEYQRLEEYILEEKQDYAESFSRSHSEGWYYPE